MAAGRVNTATSGTPAPGAPAAAMWARLRLGVVRSLDADRERWFLWCPVALGSGIAIYFGLPAEPAAWLGAAVLAAASALLWHARRRGSGMLIAAGLALAASGFVAAQFRTHWVAAPRLTDEIGPTQVSGQVLEAEAVEGGYRVLLGSLSVASLAAARTPIRIRLRAHGRDAPPPGAWVRMRAVLTPLPAPAMPGAFDFQRHAYFQRLGGLGYAIGPLAPDPRREGGAGWRVVLDAARVEVDARLRAGIATGSSEDRVRASLASALITGKRADIPEAVMQAMRDSGLAHLLAISGLHFTLVAGLVFWAVRAVLALVPPLALRFPIRKWAAVAALAAALSYLFLSGATVPTQRAFAMLCLALLAILVDRLEVSMRPVALAATAILLVTPEVLVGASFQMSFAAVVALVAGYEGLRDARRRRRATGAPGGSGIVARMLVYVAGVGFTTVIAGMATAPFSLYHFNQFATHGIAANLVAVPVTAFLVMPAGVAALLAMPFGLERFPLFFMGQGIDVIVAVATEVSSWPGAAVAVTAMPAAGLLTIALGGLWLTLWRSRWRLFGLLGVALGLATLAFARPPDLLVAEDGRLIGIRQDDRLWLSTLRGSAFVRTTWLRRTGSVEASPWPRDGSTPDGSLACDGLGCIYRRGPHRVLLPAAAAALAEDCGSAGLVVTGLSVRWRLRRLCGTAAIIDRNALRRQGAHAVWLNPAGTAGIATVRGAQGQRPWVLPPPTAGRYRQ